MIQCKACQAELPKDSAFCGHCGAKIKKTNPAKETSFGLTSITEEERAALQAATEATLAKNKQDNTDVSPTKKDETTTQELAFSKKARKTDDASTQSSYAEEDQSVKTTDKLQIQRVVAKKDDAVDERVTRTKKKKKRSKDADSTGEQREEKLESGDSAVVAGSDDAKQEREKSGKTRSTEVEALKSDETAEKRRSDEFVAQESIIEMGGEEDLDDDDFAEDENFDIFNEEAFFGASLSQEIKVSHLEELKPRSGKKVYTIILALIAILIISLSIALFLQY
ncbi:MAG: zinc ribbon domain-containing protein [Bradymonadales bacterium]|jgi:hypothetical protein